MTSEVDVAIRIEDVRDATGAAIVSGVFDRVWRTTSMVPPEVIVAAVHAGGHAAVALADSTVVGASFGLHGAPLAGEVGANLHSHATGVVPGSDMRGVGTALKLHQWRWAREHGFATVTWTFDPLVRRNAYFNLVTLGASVESYLVDFYGHLDDGLNAGDESDRLFARWQVAGRDAPTRGSRVAVGPGDALIATPEDVSRLRVERPDEARRWRERVRAEFLRLAPTARVRGIDECGSYVVAA